MTIALELHNDIRNQYAKKHIFMSMFNHFKKTLVEKTELIGAIEDVEQQIRRNKQ